MTPIYITLNIYYVLLCCYFISAFWGLVHIVNIPESDALSWREKWLFVFISAPILGTISIMLVPILVSMDIKDSLKKYLARKRLQVNNIVKFDRFD